MVSASVVGAGVRRRGAGEELGCFAATTEVSTAPWELWNLYPLGLSQLRPRAGPLSFHAGEGSTPGRRLSCEPPATPPIP